MLTLRKFPAGKYREQCQPSHTTLCVLRERLAVRLSLALRGRRLTLHRCIGCNVSSSPVQVLLVHHSHYYTLVALSTFCHSYSTKLQTQSHAHYCAMLCGVRARPISSEIGAEAYRLMSTVSFAILQYSSRLLSARHIALNLRSRLAFVVPHAICRLVQSYVANTLCS